MNILFLSHRLPFPANKGEKIRTFNQIKYLAELGHQVTVYSPIDNSGDFEAAEQFNKFQNIDSRLFGLSSKPIRLLAGMLKGQSLSEANFFSIELYQAFKSDVINSKYDAVICSSSAMGKYLFELEKENLNSKLPTLLMDFMDLDSDKWRQYASSSVFPMSWLYKRESGKVSTLEKKSQRLFNACYFIAEPEVELFKTQSDPAVNGMPNVKVLGNGLNMQEFYPSSQRKEQDSSGLTLIFTGVMDYKPNVDAVLWFAEHCWADIRRSYVDAKFIVAGMNPSAEIEKLKSVPGIEVTGFVDDILPYYHQADIFVAPFRLARGVQNKVLQAFACGLPVVTTPMGAEGINCKDGEHLFLAETPEQFVQKVVQLKGDSKLCERIGSNALELIESEFSWAGKLKPMLKDLGM